MTLGGSELHLDLTRQDSALLPKRESTIQYKTANLCSEIPAGSVSGEQDESARAMPVPARRGRDRITSTTFLRGKRCYLRERSPHHTLASL